MKKIYIFIFIIFGQLICSGDYSVTIRVEDYSWRSGGREWECMLYADLYYNGELLEPSSEYKYAWYEKRVTASEYSFRKEGYGQNYASRYIDGEPFEFFDNKVFVEGTNFTVNAYALVGRAEYPQEIQLYGYREDNTEIIESEYIKVFMNPNWKGFGIPLGPNETDCWLSLNKNEILWTDNRIIENPKEKYHHWNYDNNEIQNHHTFFIDDNIHEFIIHTKQVVSAHLQCGNYSSGNNNIEFLDPWYPDRNELGGIKQNAGTHQNAYWHGYINLEIEPDNEDEYKGVFKNLNPTVNDNYYSVRSPVEPTVNYGDREVTFFRVGGWQTNSACTLTTPNNISNGYYETPVIFTADNAEIKVAYKGHLASDNSRATGYNNGRRITWGNGDLHLVYEDDDQIWYTRSDNEGETWVPEVCISNIASSMYSSHHNPSVTELNNQIFVVWEGITDDEGDYPQPLRNILFRKADISGETTSWFNEIKDVGFNTEPNDMWCVGPDVAKPVICANSTNGLFVAWRACPPDSDPLSHGYIAHGNLDGYFNAQYDAAVQIPNCYDFPVIEMDKSSVAYPQVVVIWSNWGNDITSMRGTHTDTDWSWEAPRVLNGNNPLDNYSDPSLSLDEGRYAYITWEAENLSANGNKELWYGSYDLTRANPQMSLIRVEESGGSCDPVISLNYSTDLPTIFYSKYGSVIRYKQSSNLRWNQQGFLSGDYPNISSGGGSGAVWSRYHDEPYLIKNDYVEQINPSPLPVKIPLKPIITHTYAIATVGSDTGYITIKLNKVDFNNESITFADPLESDTVIAPISVIPMELEMEVTTCNLNNPPAAQDILFKVDFIDGAQTIPLTDLRYHEIPDTSIVFSKSITANNLHYRQGFLRFGFVNHEPYSYFTLAEEDTAGLAKQSAFKLDVIPDQYSLEQNYPNPFNPLTYITFRLPVQNEVSLDVYNINGQRVKKLISGERPAGTHQVIFNGSDLASGIYIYRLQAGSYHETKRMLLVK